jgi:hypothetical protein
MAVPSDLVVTDPVVTDPVVTEALADAIARAPVWEKRVLEIGLGWPSGSPDQAWAAERLRVFLLTWDPFEWQPDRPVAFATSASRADDARLVLYLPLWQALRMAGGGAAGLAGVVGSLAESVLSVAGEQRDAIIGGTYPEGVQGGRLPRLLSRVSDGPAAGTRPALSVVGDGWQPIQFDVLEDLAQDGFGPADLARSPVRFSEPGDGRASCPGCAGQAILFPDGLKDAQEAICGPHRAEALQITTARLEAAKASNPPGWEALLDAGQRLLEPHLPNGLGPRLVAASSVEAPTIAQLRDHAALVEAAAALMAGLPDPQTALGGRLTPVRRWLAGLPATLADAGLADEAARVTVAAAELLAAPAAAPAVAGAEAGAEAEAEAEAEEAPPKQEPYRRDVRIGRNALCPCGSGKKYKFCHLVAGGV